MKQVDESKQVPRLDGMSPEEIVNLFKGYNFVDDHGHRLNKCEDFTDLVELATRKSGQRRRSRSGCSEK